MSFASELEALGLTNETLLHDAFVKATELVHGSILDGSELTGSPGQPIVTGALYASWIPEFTSDSTWEISTNLAYARPIEDGANDRAFFDPSRQNGSITNRRERSPVGGYHSVKLTEASWDRIVVEAVAQATVNQR